jgi:Fur family transcriptional regulator, zinc uptake regulator
MSVRPAPAQLNDMQKRICDLLIGANKPMSAYDVIDALREHGRIAPPTVYRALQKLIDEGLAHRIETQNAYVACRHGDEAHAHSHRAGFMICRLCGKTQEFGDAEIGDVLARIAARKNFAAERVAIEIQGLCADCGKAD